MSTEITDDKSKGQSKAPTKSTEAVKAKGPVYIDYDGTIGRATVEQGALSNQRAVPHKLSPLMMFWPENGTPDLNLQPGINLVDADLWTLYTRTVNDGKGLPQLKDKIERGFIKELTGMPRNDKEAIDLVDRSLDAAGLTWLEAQETAGKARPEVLDAIKERMAKSVPVQLGKSKFQGRVPNLPQPKANDAQPAAAMG